MSKATLRRKGHSGADRSVLPLALLLVLVVVVQFGALWQFERAFEERNRISGVTGLATTEQTGEVGFAWRPSPFICQVPLLQGWSFISLCSQPDNNTISSLMSGIDYRFIMRWNLTNQSFDIYSRSAADPPFSVLEYNTSYFVSLNSVDDTIDLIGQPVGDLNISLVQGWNGPGFPYLFNTTIVHYFNSSDHSYLMKWNASAQEFIIYSPRAANNPFERIYLAEGQLINSLRDQMLSYNTTDLQSP
jgi:hypothetical protein